MENASFSMIGSLTMITLEGLRVQQAEVEAFNRIPIPTDVLRLCTFMGLTNEYCRFV